MPHLRPVNQAHVRSGLPWRNGLLLMLLVLGVLSPAGASAQSEGVVSGTSGVNIRACPTLDCQVIGSASLGEPIDITGDIIDGFYPVRWYDREGYVFALYVTHAGGRPGSSKVKDRVTGSRWPSTSGLVKNRPRRS